MVDLTNSTYGGGAEAGRGSGSSDRGPREPPDRFGPITTLKRLRALDGDAREMYIQTVLIQFT